MRLALAAFGLAVFAIAETATAGEVALAPVSFTPRFESVVTRDLGSSEGDVLRASVTRAVGNALARRGATISARAPITIEVAIVDANPNRVTVQELRRHPMLDPRLSVSLGGAALHAMLRSSNGATLREVDYQYYDPSFSYVVGPLNTWTSADRAITLFAERVADAYVAESGAR